jgi:hypothetical protein
MESGACRDRVAEYNRANDEGDNKQTMRFATVIYVGLDSINEIGTQTRAKSGD